MRERREEAILRPARLLRLIARAPQLVLRGLQVVHVGPGADPGFDRSPGISHRYHPGENPALARTGEKAALQGVRPLLRDCGIPDPLQLAAVVGMDELDPSRPEGAFALSDDLLPPAIQ